MNSLNARLKSKAGSLAILLISVVYLFVWIYINSDSWLSFSSKRADFIGFILFQVCSFGCWWTFLKLQNSSNSKSIRFMGCFSFAISCLIAATVVTVGLFKFGSDALLKDKMGSWELLQVIRLRDNSRLALYRNVTGPLSPDDVFLLHEIPVTPLFQLNQKICWATGDNRGQMTFDEDNGRIVLETSHHEGRRTELSLKDRVKLPYN